MLKFSKFAIECVSKLFLSSQLKAKPERKLAKQICKVVLDHFEKQYSKELGDAWNTVRLV